MTCRGCRREYPIEPINVCEFCFGPLEITYDYDGIARNISRESITQGPQTMWRYDAFLPVRKEDALDMGTGLTPLLKADNLGKLFGLDS